MRPVGVRWRHRSGVHIDIALIGVFDRLTPEEASALGAYIEAVEADTVARYEHAYAFERVLVGLFPIAGGATLALALVLAVLVLAAG